MALSSDIRKLLQFAKEIEGLSGEALLQACLEANVGVIQSPGYNPFHGRDDQERREWKLYALFNGPRMGGENAGNHVEWLCQRPFQNVSEWLGPEGDKFRAIWRMHPIPDQYRAAWTKFAADHVALSEADIFARLGEIGDNHPVSVGRVRRRRA